MFAYLLASGLTLGALYALAAVGLVIVVKATSVVNLAQGEMFMFGGFFGFLFHVQLGLPYLPSLLLAVAAAFVMGGLVYHAAFRPLMKSGLVSVLLASIAVSFILKGVARAIWGGVGDYFVSADVLGPVDPVRRRHRAAAAARRAGIEPRPPHRRCILLRFTDTGKWMQAMADNVKAATLVGIPIDRLQHLTFALGAGAAGAAAVLMAPLTQLYPDIGFGIFVKAFAGAALGGLSSLPGAVLGGFLVGLIEYVRGRLCRQQVPGRVGLRGHNVRPAVPAARHPGRRAMRKI